MDLTLPFGVKYMVKKPKKEEITPDIYREALFRWLDAIIKTEQAFIEEYKSTIELHELTLMFDPEGLIDASEEEVRQIKADVKVAEQRLKQYEEVHLWLKEKLRKLKTIKDILMFLSTYHATEEGKKMLEKLDKNGDFSLIR